METNRKVARSVHITRKEHFNAAHRLQNPNWSKEKNIEVFGPCANENWHGHNFELSVTVKGSPSSDTGFVINFKDLGKIIKSEIIELVDHKNLNLDVDFMKDKMPTCEVFIIEIWNILDAAIMDSNTNAKLYKLLLVETPGNYAEYFGDNS